MKFHLGQTMDLYLFQFDFFPPLRASVYIVRAVGFPMAEGCFIRPWLTLGLNLPLCCAHCGPGCFLYSQGLCCDRGMVVEWLARWTGAGPTAQSWMLWNYPLLQPCLFFLCRPPFLSLSLLLPSLPLQMLSVFWISNLVESGLSFSVSVQSLIVGIFWLVIRRDLGSWWPASSSVEC